MSKTIWTKELLDRLAQLMAENLPVQAIADRMGISKKAVEGRLYWDRMTPEALAKRRAAVNARRRELHEKADRRITIEQVQVSARPSDEQIKQRDMRLAMPYRDLTASFFGDPPIGFSALDQRA